jgi:hypothetical protein
VKLEPDHYDPENPEINSNRKDNNETKCEKCRRVSGNQGFIFPPLQKSP